MDQQVATPLSNVGAEHGEVVELDRGVLRRAWASLRRDKPALFGAVVVLAFVLVAVFAPAIAPHDPAYQFAEGLTNNGTPLPPGGRFLLGTDDLGRDLLSRLIYGAQVSLTIGVLANLLAVVIGVAVGSISAYAGGWVDMVLMRITDIMMAFPVLLFAIALIAITGPSLENVILVIAILYWTTTARVIHGMVLSLKEREFVEAARALGAGGPRILLLYILPHLVSVIIVYTTLGVASTVLVEASLSYVGISVPLPTPTWGNIINEAQSYYHSDPWMMIFPGLAILVTVLGFNLLGDWLRDTLDPVQSNAR
jgi:peptide/nickel transport system permease protein